LMMSLWDALRMNMMISYQGLVRTFLSYHVNIFIFFFIILMFAGGMFESLYTYLTMSSQRTNLGATSALMGAASLVIPSVIGGVGSFLIELNTSIWMMYLLLIILIMIYMLKKYQTLTVTDRR
ncbi:Bcr/CflA family drug resistance efflux transporter, partial [Citrobacter freundii]